MTKPITIVGGGIVGATAAYYLTRFGHQVTVYDEGTGQATSASAGIICPWLSKRRNKDWYRLAAGGAAFYQQLIADLKLDGADPSFYQQTGAILLKKKAKSTQEQYEIGLKRRELAPEIGDLKILTEEELAGFLPTLQTQKNALYVSGAARVDGSLLVESLLTYVKENGGRIRRERFVLEEKQAADETIILAAGAWLPQILEPLGWKVDIRGQKGQLAILKTEQLTNGSEPVIMPEGEIDVLPIGDGKVIVGATHENEAGYDLSLDEAKLAHLIEQGKELFPDLADARFVEGKVGTRAYTSDFSPFFGYLPTRNKNILLASGLGSSGLTTGPLIGYQLALLAAGKTATLPLDNYLPDTYLNN